MPLVLAGATSGSTTLNPTDAVTATLTLPSSTGTLLSTANPQSGGVIQVVGVTNSTAVSTTSTTLASSGVTASITPKFSTSKILVIFNGLVTADGGSGSAMALAIYRGATQLIADPTNQGYSTLGGTGSTFNPAARTTMTFLDSPATTSATTYTIYYAAGSGTATVTATVNKGNNTSTLTLMEIAA